MDDVYYGVLVSLCANISITVGHHMRRSDDELDLSSLKLDHSKTRSKRRSLREWMNSLCNKVKIQCILGRLLFLGGTMASAYSLAYAPQTLLACIGSIQFVTNLVCSKIFHGNRITFANILGTFAVIIGCLFIVFGFSAHGQQKKKLPTINQLFQNYNTHEYTVYVVITLVIASFSLICGMFCGSQSSMESVHLSRKKLTHLTSNGASWFDLKKVEYYWTIASGVTYAICSAMPGSLSVVLGKTLAIITRRYVGGKLHLWDPIDYFNWIFIGMVFISWAATQIYWMHRYNISMKIFDPVFILPMNQVMWITFSTVGGGLYFREFENATYSQWFSLIGGLSINYAGLFHLAPSSETKKTLTYADVSNMDLKRPKFTKKSSQKNIITQENTNDHKNESTNNMKHNSSNGINNKSHKKSNRHNIGTLDHRMKSNRFQQIQQKMHNQNCLENNSGKDSKNNSNKSSNNCLDSVSGITSGNIGNEIASINESGGKDCIEIEMIGSRIDSREASVEKKSLETSDTSRKYSGIFANWMHSAYNIVKDAMLSPPLIDELIDSQSEALLSDMDNVLRMENDVESYLPVLTEEITMEEEEMFDSFDEYDKKRGIKIDMNMNMDMDMDLNMNGDSEMNMNMNMEKNFESDSDDSDNSSSSVCLHDSPMITSSDSNNEDDNENGIANENGNNIDNDNDNDNESENGNENDNDEIKSNNKNSNSNGNNNRSKMIKLN